MIVIPKRRRPYVKTRRRAFSLAASRSSDCKTRKIPPPIVATLLVLITITTQCKPLLASEVPRATAIERLQIGISEERYREAAQAWVDTVAGGDFDVTKAAFEDLVFAPHEAQKRVLDQMENSAALVNLFNSLNRQNRQQLLEVLLPFGKSTLGLQNALAQELHSLSLSRDDLQYVSNICILFQSHGKLSDPVQAQLVASVTRSSDPQVRQAIASVLIDKAQLLGSREADFRTWFQSRETVLHRLGLQLLLRTRATLSSDSVDEALRDATGELQSDALRYVTSIPTQNIDQERLKIIGPWFDHPSSAEQWELSYRALAAKSPEILNAYFEKLGGRVTEWNKLKPEILVRILEVLPPTRDQALASWKLLQAGSQKELLSDESRVDLLILLRRARVGTDISADLFDSIQHIQGSDVASMRALADLVNRVLLARVQGIDDFGKFLLTKWQSSEFDTFRDQIGALTGRTFETEVRFPDATPLARTLSPPLAAALENGKNETALDLMRLNAPADSGLLSSDAVLRNYRTSQQLRNETALGLLAHFHRIPDDIVQNILAIAKDTSATGTLRQSAIYALGGLEDAYKYTGTFTQIAQETAPLPSAAALGALIPIYSKRATDVPVLSPTDGWLLHAASDELTRQEAPDFFTVLSRQNKDFSYLLAQSLGSDLAEHRCWDLLASNTVPVEVWLYMLDSALRHQDQRDHLRACISTLVSDQKDARVIALALNGEDRLVPTTSSDRRDLFDALTNAWPHTKGLPVLRSAMANEAVLLSSTLPYTPLSVSQIRAWANQVKAEEPQASKSLGDEAMRRGILLFIIGIPLLVFAHIGLWVVLLFIYPHSVTVQSVVFWNRLVRKILALGYMDAVVLIVPFARRRILAPFQEQMLKDVLQPSELEGDRFSYYPHARVKKLSVSGSSVDQIAEQPILEALAKLRQRTLLLGASGLGKSSFLRYRLMQKTNADEDCVVYLPATRCTGGVEKAISSRIQVFALDPEMLRSLIHAGRLEVYIDGYNEVDLATQEEITTFTATFSKAKILVASQIPLRGLSRIETLELQSLEPDEIEKFLTSRAAILSETAVIRGGDYEKLASSYLLNLWATVKSDAERSAYELVLSNPMDLTTAAMALGNGKEPNLLSLQEQQFEIMSARHLKIHGTPFRTDLFSEDVFNRRVAGDDDLTKSPFDREVASLIAEKMALVRTVEVRGRPAQQEIRFRHDRIRDYVTYFAFLGDEREERRLSYSKDSRFAGVFEYLAKMLPPGPAERLKEYLIMRAVETQDHRLSDSFIRQMSWRQQFALADPAWMSEIDFPAAKQADLDFDRLQSERKNIEHQLLGLREVMSSQRALTRILTTFDDDALLNLAVDCLMGLGAQSTSPGKEVVSGIELRSPESFVFSVAAVGSRTLISNFQVDPLVQRAERLNKPVILITNSQIEKPPAERRYDLAPEVCDRLRGEKLFPCSTFDLYAAYKSFMITGKNDFWLRGELPWKKTTAV